MNKNACMIAVLEKQDVLVTSLLNSFDTELIVNGIDRGERIIAGAWE